MTARFMFVVLIISAILEIAFADGKFYNKNLLPYVPGQRALLLHDSGEELLVLQSSYESGAGSFGWVVPLPAIPKLESMSSLKADEIFSRLDNVSSPKYIDLGRITIVLIALIWSAILISINAYYHGRYKALLNLTLVFFTVLMIAACPMLMIYKDDGVHIVKEQSVGIYDIKVIQSNNSDRLVEWLNQNRFQFAQPDVAIFEHYINQNWCFVVAITSELPQRTSHIAMTDPLILSFQTPVAVYPLALTASAGAQTDVQLFVLSSKRMDCKGRLQTDYAGKVETTLIKDLSESLKGSFEDSFQPAGKEFFLTRFYGNLSPEEMKTDLYFEFAKDNHSYRRTNFIW